MALSDLVVELHLDASNFEQGCTSASRSISALQMGIEGAGAIGDAIGVTATAGFGVFGAVAGTAVDAIADISSELIGFAKDAAFLPTIEEGFNRISISAGKSGQTMLEELTAASGGMISAADLMTNFNQAAMLISPTIATELPNAMEMLQKVSMSTGTSMEYLMNSLVVGVGRASPRILDNMGIQIKATEAYDAYAKSIGKTVSELTKAEQSEAIWRMTLEKLEQNTKNIPDVQDSAAASIQRFQATIKNLKDELGVAFLPTLADFTETFTDFAVALSPLAVSVAEGFGKMFGSLLEVIEPVIPIITRFADGLSLVFDLFSEGKIETGMSILTTLIGNLGEKLAPVLEDVIVFGSNLIFGIVRGVSNAIPSLLQTMNDLLPMVLGVLEEIIPGALEVGLGIIVNVANGIAEGLPSMIESFGSITTNLLQVITDKIPDLMGAGTKILEGIAEGLETAIPEFIAKAPVILSEFVQNIAENLPGLLSAGIGVLTAIIDGIILAIPAFIAQAPTIITSLLTAIIESIDILLTAGVEIIIAIIEGITANIDQIVTSGIEIINALIQGIIDSIDLIITAVTELIPLLVTAVIENAPLLLEAGIELIGALIDGLLSVELWTTVGELVAALIIAFGDEGGKLFDSGIELLNQVMDGIDSMLDSLGQKALDAVVAFLNGLDPGLGDALLMGIDWVTNLIDGIGEKISEVTNKAAEIVTEFIGGIEDGVGDMVTAGYDLLMGLAEGIGSAVGDVIAKAQEVASSIVGAVKGFFGIESPSKVFMEFGLNLGKGLEIGIIESMGHANLALEREMKGVGFDFNNFDRLVPEYKQNNYNLTMPTTANAGDVRMAFELMEAWGT